MILGFFTLFILMIVFSAAFYLMQAMISHEALDRGSRKGNHHGGYGEKTDEKA